MDRLRVECPWDAEQTPRTLAPYLLEECYEALEAIEAGDATATREELGDVLLQVVFHARIAQEAAGGDRFDVDDVARGIADKLVRRHPHVFADTAVSGSGDVIANWDKLKAAEKNRTSAFDGVPAGLPALARAQAVLGRARRAGLTGQTEQTGHTEQSEPVPEDASSLADRLLALVAEADAAGVDAEQLLRDAVREVETGLRTREDTAR